MNINASSKIMCRILVLILFLSPVFSTADALLLSFTESLAYVATESSDMPCHTETNESLAFETTSSDMDMNFDCCEEVCLCDDMSCQVFTSIFQLNGALVFSSLALSDFEASQYLSFIPPLGSPPPIS